MHLTFFIFLMGTRSYLASDNTGGLPLPNMYIRDYSIRIDAGKDKFCAFIDLDPIHKVSITYRVYSADVNTAQTHRVAMSLSTLDQVILDKTNFGVEGEIKDVQIPSNESYELCFDGSPSINDNQRVSFYVIIEGKVDEELANELERIEKLEMEEDISFYSMKDTLDKIQFLQRKADMMQWKRKQSLSQDMSKMEATLYMVDKWSFMHVVIIVCVAILQACTFRNMFSTCT